MHRALSHNLLIHLIFSLALILLAGCADDLRNRSVFDCGDGDVVIRFSVENVILTREGESQDFESVVDHAYLLFYADNASINSGVPIAAVRADVDAEHPGALKFNMPLRLQPNTDYKLLAIANSDNYAPSGFNNFGEYIESWCGNSSSETEFSPIQLYCGAKISPESVENLPMSGGVEGNSVFRYSIENGVYDVSSSLSFRRKVARIDVANIVKEGFKVEGVLLCNWCDAVAASSAESTLGNTLGAVHGVLSDESASDDMFITMPDADDSGIQQLTEMIYCFPSVSYDSHNGDKQSTSLIIKAKYGSDLQSTYYRVNVGQKGNVSEVKANTKYLVTIQSVKGSGASTAEEAYSAAESPIVLSVVEDWDLEGDNFAMDDKGNFVIVSRGSIEFEGDANDNVEIRVLTSKGLSWTAEYLADNEESASAFNVNSLSNLIVIGTNAKNETEQPLTGKCKVSATTSDGEMLTVYIALTQNVGDIKPEVPVIPDDMPFALIPESYDRVKIDHENRTIEIDGFDPDCFNSFIDIPFKVYIKESLSDAEEISISSTLEWPLEGRISEDRSSEYTYCDESFSPFGFGKINTSSGILKSYDEIFQSSISIQKNNSFYISVGAMGPDDPSIIRNLTLDANGQQVEYILTIKPRRAIIDDVILLDDTNNPLMVMDRNVQVSLASAELLQYAKRNEDGSKKQAYNYCEGPVITIPFKYKDEQKTPFSENQHILYLGDKLTFGTKSNFKVRRTDWLWEYRNLNASAPEPNFYADSNDANKPYLLWVFPYKHQLELCCRKMSMSKLRMFLVSDISAMQDEVEIPICCYWPYVGKDVKETTYNKYGYFYKNNWVIEEYPDVMLYIFYDGKEIKSYEWNNDQDDYGLSRLVRTITKEELETYKQNYLGHGIKPLLLPLCHPDNYDSSSLGWCPY